MTEVIEAVILHILFGSLIVVVICMVVMMIVLAIMAVKTLLSQFCNREGER